MSAHGPIGLFGKIPAQADFLRVNASDPAALALVRWLEEGNDALYRAGARLSAEPLGFLFPSFCGDRALVGAIGPGSDKVGRSFPLAVFVPARDLAGTFPLVPVLYRAFLDAARELLAAAAELAPPQIGERLSRLPLPGPSDAAAALTWAREAGGERARDLQQRLFTELPEGQQYYAFRTFQVACQPLRGRDPGRVNLALDCPCAREGDAWVWLELGRRALGWPQPPPFFWRGGAAPGLVLSLGAPPPAILPFLSAPPRESQRIWPLKTRQAPAVASARKALSAAQLATMERSDVTVDELVASLCRF
jgi:type VI secretion system protein ImpM